MILWRNVILFGFIGVNSFYDNIIRDAHYIFYGQRKTTKKDMAKLAIFNRQKHGFRKRGGFAMIVIFGTLCS